MSGLPTLSPHKLALIILASLSTLCLGAAAQVYQSTDEQGNISFSDTPTPESKAVTIQQPNVGDAVEVPPPAPEPVIEAEPAMEELPPELQGQLVGQDKRSKKRKRPRKEPRGGR